MDSKKVNRSNTNLSSSMKALKVRKLLSEVIKDELAITPRLNVTYISNRTKAKVVMCRKFSDISTDEN